MSVALPTTADNDHRARSARQPPIALVVRHPVVLVARGFCERIAVEAPHRPSILGGRASRAIELLRGSVPIEHRPFHPRPAALDREPRHPLEQRPTNALTAKALGHEEVFEVQSGAAAPGAEVAKKSANPAGSPSCSAIRHSNGGSGCSICARISAGVAATECASCSYSASPRMKCIITSASAAVANRIFGVISIAPAIYSSSVWRSSICKAHSWTIDSVHRSHYAV
jgi:hypothetical protein